MAERGTLPSLPLLPSHLPPCQLQPKPGGNWGSLYYTSGTKVAFPSLSTVSCVVRLGVCHASSNRV